MATQSPSLSLLIMPSSQPWWWARSAAPLMAAMSAYARTSLISGPGGILHTRGQPSISVNASCLSEFSWMNNGKGQSPCVVAAWEEEPCASSTWNVVALPPGFQYDPPNSTEANACSCSWATYNLFAACTVCQNSTEFVSWGDWQYNCGEFVSDTTYFPSDKNFTLPTETSIPFWAGTDPQTWSDATFNVTEAQAIQSQGHADLTGTPVSSKKSNTAAIVGGAVGGLAVIFLLIASFVWIVVKRRKGTQQPKSYPGGNSRPELQHLHSLFDSTEIPLNPNGLGVPSPYQMSSVTQPYTANAVSYSMQNVWSPGPHSPPSAMSPTAQRPNSMMSLVGGPSGTPAPAFSSSPIQGHMSSTSIQSLGGALASLAFSSPSARRVSLSSSQSNLENVITPFMSGHTSPQLNSHKGAARHSPNASYDFAQDGLLTFPVTSLSPASPHRARMNPPTYTAATGSGGARIMASAPGLRKHEYGASVDSNRSNSHSEEIPLNGTGVSTGVASYGDGSFETSPPRSGSGRSTFADLSDLEDTLFDCDDGVQARRPGKDSLSDIVAGVRAGVL